MALPTASDNAFSSLLITEGSAPASPAAGKRRLYVLSSDHLAYLKDSSGTVVGLTLGGYVPGGTDVAIADGGTGASTATAGFDALSPMTTAGDLIIGGASGTRTRLAAGATSGHVLTSNGSGAAPSWQAAAGAGGLTQAYVGYNTIGGSFDVPGVNSKIYAKSVTIATACLITSIGGYFQSGAGTSFGPAVALYSDNAGAPQKYLGGGPAAALVDINTNGARWIDMPLGIWVPAATYWLAVRTSDAGAGAVIQLAYDGSGGDVTKTGAAGAWGDLASLTSTSNKFSIRANTIR